MKTLFLIGALTVIGCAGPSEDTLAESSGPLRYGRPAERPLILHSAEKPSEYSLGIKRDDLDIVILVENNESEPVYVPGNILTGMADKEPALSLFVTNMQGVQLRKCGVFEVGPNQLDAILVSSHEKRRFEIPLQRLREVYCTDEFMAQVLVVLVRPRNGREVLAHSNRLIVQTK